RRVDRQVARLRWSEPDRQPGQEPDQLRSELLDLGLSTARSAMAAVLRADVDSISLTAVAERPDAPGLQPSDARDLRPWAGAAHPHLANSESEPDDDHLRFAGVGIDRARRGHGRHRSI